MSSIKLKNIKQTVIGSTTQPLKIGGILEDGSDAKIVIDSNGNTTFNQVVGFKFPSTQVPSSDPNTLDDYEEGTWTMTLNGTTPSSFTGRYTKIGRLVYCYCYTYTMTSTAVTANIGGFPFLANASFPVITTTHNNWTSSTSQNGYIQSNDTNGTIIVSGTPGSPATALAGTTYLMLNVVYNTY